MSLGPPRRFPPSPGASQTPPIVGSALFNLYSVPLHRRRWYPPTRAEVNTSHPGLVPTSWQARGPPLKRRTYANLRPAAHVPLDCASVSCQGLLPPRCRSYALYARKLWLVDWHEHLNEVVASPLSTVPGANVFQINGALTHPVSPLALAA